MITTQDLRDQVDRMDRHFDTTVREGGREAALGLRDETVRVVDTAIQAWCAHAERPADEVGARILVGVDDVFARDLVSIVERFQLDGAIEFWTDLVRRAPADWSAAPWCILGLLRWQRGNRPGAVEAGLRALAEDPAYRMARYLLCAIEGGLRPRDLYGRGGTLQERRERLVPRCSA